MLTVVKWDARTMRVNLDATPIVDVSDIAAIPNVVVCDVRWYLDGRPGRSTYDEGHLPGAVFVDLGEHLVGNSGLSMGRHPLPSPKAFARSMGMLGIGPEDPVVAYDDASGMAASRLVWMLRILGRPAALIDGGLQAWRGPLETSGVTRPVVKVPAVPWPSAALATIGEVADMASGKIRGLVLDARAGERYSGDSEPVDPQAGHIPGARSAPFADNLESDGSGVTYFFNPGELANRYRELGVADASDVVAYCGSGVSACHNLLAMEYAGLGRGRLFVGSWSQWSHSGRPVATGMESE
ncbi:MAG: sulfurtransferase [Acidimicrobiales bacterium]|nr:sulfurtransferase [Acidimicrobiales bacterium]